MTPRRRVVSDRAQRAQPFARTRAAPIDHHQGVQPTCREHVKDLREGEQFAPDLMNPLLGTRDLNLVGLHSVFSDQTSTTPHRS
jgi:hypothetical protein